MIEVFKILHNVYDSDTTQGMPELSCNTVTRGHSLKLSTQRQDWKSEEIAFAVRVMKTWNSLAGEVTNVTRCKSI